MLTARCLKDREKDGGRERGSLQPRTESATCCQSLKGAICKKWPEFSSKILRWPRGVGKVPCSDTKYI